MKNTFFILLVCVLFTSCYGLEDNKIKLREIQCRILSLETKLPIEKIKTGLYYRNLKPVDSLSSNIDGFILYSFLSYGTWDHKVKVLKNSFFDDYLIEPEESQDIYLNPRAFIKLYVKNTNPYDENDMISINSYINEDYKRIGKNIDETVIYSVSYNSNYGYPKEISYDTKKNGVYKIERFKANLKSFDTLKVNINY